MRSKERTSSSPSSSAKTIGTEVTDQDIERYLARVEEEKSRDYWNVSTAAGLGLIAVGTAYLFQQLGFWEGEGLDMLALMLPWIAGVLIILIGFGLISRQPSTRKRDEDTAEEPEPTQEHEPISSTSNPSDTVSEPTIGQAAKNFVKAIRHTAREKRLIKSTDKKISGVCSGLGDYFGIDPTIVRLAFVIATVVGGGAPVLIYVGLMIAMPGPEESVGEQTRVSVTRT